MYVARYASHYFSKGAIYEGSMRIELGSAVDTADVHRNATGINLLSKYDAQPYIYALTNLSGQNIILWNYRNRRMRSSSVFDKLPKSCLICALSVTITIIILRSGARCFLNLGRVVLGRVFRGAIVLVRVVFGASCPVSPPGKKWLSGRLGPT